MEATSPFVIGPPGQIKVSPIGTANSQTNPHVSAGADAAPKAGTAKARTSTTLRAAFNVRPPSEPRSDWLDLTTFRKILPEGAGDS